jgi:hypothetical protein
VAFGCDEAGDVELEELGTAGGATRLAATRFAHVFGAAGFGGAAAGCG